MSQEKHYARALTIAGSDSGGGAGIQADLKTFAANGCYGMSVITALTAQNTVGVRSIFAVPMEMVRDQMEAVLTDIGADAIKIGMLFSPLLIRTVANGLRTWEEVCQWCWTRSWWRRAATNCSRKRRWQHSRRSSSHSRI